MILFNDRSTDGYLRGVTDIYVLPKEEGHPFNLNEISMILRPEDNPNQTVQIEVYDKFKTDVREGLIDWFDFRHKDNNSPDRDYCMGNYSSHYMQLNDFLFDKNSGYVKYNNYGNGLKFDKDSWTEVQLGISPDNYTIIINGSFFTESMSDVSVINSEAIQMQFINLPSNEMGMTIYNNQDPNTPLQDRFVDDVFYKSIISFSNELVVFNIGDSINYKDILIRRNPFKGDYNHVNTFIIGKSSLQGFSGIIQSIAIFSKSLSIEKIILAYQSMVEGHL